MSLPAPQLLVLEQASSADDPRDGLKTALEVLADERIDVGGQHMDVLGYVRDELLGRSPSPTT